MTKRRSKKQKQKNRSQNSTHITSQKVQVSSAKQTQPSFLQKLFLDRLFLASLVMLILIIGIGIVAIDLERNTRILEDKIAAKLAVEQEQKKWEAVVTKYPGYRDGYFKLAEYEYQLGNNKKALSDVQQALFIDPNFKTGRKFEAFLMGKQ